MKAIVYTEYGPPDVLQLSEVPRPLPNDNEVLVRVKAASVNRTDCANLRAKPSIMRLTMGLFKPKKQILGTEFAGEVAAIGNEVTAFKVGDRVFGFADSGASSYAEYLVMEADKGIDIIPQNLNYKQAAACIEGVHYAYNFINKVKLKKGDKVLVNGASGGIGVATAQLLKYFGAEVTAVCPTQAMPLVQSIGANRIIDYLQEDFTKDNEQYEFVFDTVGKSSFGKCKHLLKPGGVYISSELGWMIQNVWYSLITAILGSLPGQGGRKVKFPYPPDIKRSIVLLKKIIEEGKYKPVIDRTYSLEQITEAFRYVETGEKIGNVAITIN